ncbi:hypothetical protein [Virgibacillus saliphilus]|nr:hypothetical protein [Virgibacillus sp. NKC19-3]
MNVDSLILDCTELHMILNDDDDVVVLLHTMDIHVDKMVEELFR